jgi:aminoglycoside 6'-N-acetyltransferase I
MDAILTTPDEQAVFFCVDPQRVFLGFAEVSLRKSPCPGCRSSPVGYLEGWYVIETARGQGVGARLIEAAENWARSKGCTEMASDTVIENTASEAAHKRLGYEVASRVICFRKSLERD